MKYLAFDLAREHMYVADLTGDTLPELVVTREATPQYFFNYGGTFVGPTLTKPTKWPGVILTPGHTLVGSLTGDGRTTLLVRPQPGRSRYTRLQVGASPSPSDATSQESELAAPAQGDPGAMSYRFADWNDDGLDDALATGYPLTRESIDPKCPPCVLSR